MDFLMRFTKKQKNDMKYPMKEKKYEVYKNRALVISL